MKSMKSLLTLAGLTTTVVSLGVISHPVFAENVEYNVNVGSSMNVTLSTNSIQLEVNASTKAFDSKDLTLSVGTNNAVGYEVIMSSKNTSLVNTNDRSKRIETLPALDGGYTEDTFAVNKWGYKIGNGNYIPFVSGVVVAENDSNTNSEPTTLSFASKVDNLQAAGQYNMVLSFMAVAKMGAVEMQNLDNSLCTTSPRTAIDNRDGQMYTIQRLKDGNCWMMRNLDLGAVDLTEDLTSANTHLVDTISAETFNNWKTETGSKTYTEGEFINVEGVDEANDTPYGTLYNYCAASAGTICTDSNANDATSDLCPAGWHLPSIAEYSGLSAKYNSNVLMRSSIAYGGANFTLSGLFSAYGPSNVGDYSKYWSTTRNSNYAMKYMALNTAATNMVAYENSNTGSSIRCVLDDTRTLADLNTMQEPITKGMLNNTPNGGSATVVDTRDNKSYTIAKVNGSVWMTSNLRFTGTRVEPETTNTETSKTLVYYDLASDNCKYEYDGEQGGLYNSCIKEGLDDSGNPTVWYNYPAASLGETTGPDNYNTNYHDLCPAGWGMPDYDQIDTISGSTYIADFNPTLGGIHDGGGEIFNASQDAYWWSSKTSGGNNRWVVYYNGSTLQRKTYATYSGLYIRCRYKM